MMHIIIKYLIFGKSSVSNIYMKWAKRLDVKQPGANTHRGELTAPSSDVSLHDLFALVIVLHW